MVWCLKQIYEGMRKYFIINLLTYTGNWWNVDLRRKFCFWEIRSSEDDGGVKQNLMGRG